MSDDSETNERVSFEDDSEDVSLDGEGEDTSVAESHNELEMAEDQLVDGEDEGDDGDNDSEDGVKVKKSSKTSLKLSSKDAQDITTVALDRTIFVGNLPSKLSHRDVVKIFKVCGPVESARIRSIVPDKEKLSQKVASITKRIHPKVDSVNAYVVFAKSENDESITKALAMNGTIIDDHRIRVDRAQQANAKRMTLTSRKKSVFVGNLRFDLRDDDLISHFQKAGSIDYVRLVRDKTTGMGKGFGFVKFMDRVAVKKALELNDTDFKGRKLRVKKIDEKTKMKDDDKEGASQKIKSNNRNRPNKKFQNDTSLKSKDDDGNFRGDGNKQDRNNPHKQASFTQSKRIPDQQTRKKKFNKSNRNGLDGNQIKSDKNRDGDMSSAGAKKVKFDLKNIKRSNDQQRREGPRFNKTKVSKMNDKKKTKTILKKKFKTILKKKVKKEVLKK